MKRVLVNASAAKCGGGVTILNKFTKEKYYDKTTHYVIVSPIKPDRLGSNQTWIKKRTSFISTIMYALFGSWFTCRKYKCSSIISFSNINSLLPISKVTYFHNMLILNGEGGKWFIIRSLLRLTLKGNVFVVQTPYVKKNFLSVFGQTCQVLVKWPGIDVAEFRSNTSDLTLSSCQQKMFKVLVPIPNLKIKHKNFQLVLELAKKCIDFPILFIVTANFKDAPNYPFNNLVFAGVKNREDYLGLLGQVDATIVTSTTETVGLPIFESLVYQKCCFVFKQDYFNGIKDLFGDLEGVLEFSDANDFINAYQLAVNSSFNFNGTPFIKGDWDF